MQENINGMSQNQRKKKKKKKKKTDKARKKKELCMPKKYKMNIVRPFLNVIRKGEKNEKDTVIISGIVSKSERYTGIQYFILFRTMYTL